VNDDVLLGDLDDLAVGQDGSTYDGRHDDDDHVATLESPIQLRTYSTSNKINLHGGPAKVKPTYSLVFLVKFGCV